MNPFPREFRESSKQHIQNEFNNRNWKIENNDRSDNDEKSKEVCLWYAISYTTTPISAQTFA